MIIEKNLFIEALLPGSNSRKLTIEEDEEYRRPLLLTYRQRNPGGTGNYCLLIHRRSVLHHFVIEGRRHVL